MRRARALMMVLTEKQRVWNGLIITSIPLFAYKHDRARFKIDNC